MEVSVSKDGQEQGKSENYSAEEKEAGLPHESLFLILAYLPVFELLSMSQVCVSLRHAVKDDVLSWMNIIIDVPLNSHLSDEILFNLCLKANGSLRSLSLISCIKITDYGLQRIVDVNPLIDKLFIPGCTGLTPEGVIRAAEKLSGHNRGLKSLRINGIYNIQKEHLKTLHSLIRTSSYNEQQNQAPVFYGYNNFLTVKHQQSNCIIDVGICPKCSEVRLVYDCPRSTCKRKSTQPMIECKGCNFCTPRCEECGGCIELDSLEESVCPDILCTECWLHLPKCNFCNKPYCNRHAYQQCSSTSSHGFICHVCHDKYINLLSVSD